MLFRVFERDISEHDSYQMRWHNLKRVNGSKLSFGNSNVLKSIFCNIFEYLSAM